MPPSGLYYSSVSGKKEERRRGMAVPGQGPAAFWCGAVWEQYGCTCVPGKGPFLPENRGVHYGGAAAQPLCEKRFSHD